MKFHRTQLLGFGVFMAVTFLFFIGNAEVDEGDGGRGATDNSYMDTTDYVGSDRCGDCHSEKYTSWSETLHTMKVRPITEDIVYADFTIQPDLGFDIEVWHDEGTDTYTVNLSGTNNFTIDWLLGSGKWKQRFMVDIENGTYVLPIQWNTYAEGENKWGAYHSSDWFDAQGDPLMEDWGFVDEMPVGVTKSWQKNCAGCHSTGYTPEQNANGEWISVLGSNMAEINVGCEACHGPGGEHVKATADKKTSIWKSGDANVCAQCHVRGKSPDGEHGYPIGMNPGDDVWDHFDLADNVFWGDTEFSKKHRQQYMDWNESGHADLTPSFARRASCANCHTPEGAAELLSGGHMDELPADGVTWSVTCQACHDSHGSDNDADLRLPPEELCVTCHNAHGAAPPSDPHHPQYEVLNGKGGAGIIGDLTMGGAVSCYDCHMPYVAKSAVPYDIRSHTMSIVEPDLTLEIGVPNSCASDCHNGVGAGNMLSHETAQRVLNTWHYEIEELFLITEENLTKAETAINVAKLAGVDPMLIAEAEESFEIAEFNYKLIEAEASGGVHNFEYARSLLFDANQRSMMVVKDLDVEPPANLPPMVRSGGTQIGEPDEMLTFMAGDSYDPEGTNLTFSWNFGDSTAAGTGPTVTHTYTTAGDYEVTVTVTDEDSMVSTKKFMVYVQAAPESNDQLESRLTANELKTADLEAQAGDNEDNISDKVGIGAILFILLVAIVLDVGLYFYLNDKFSKESQPMGGGYGSIPEPPQPPEEEKEE